MELAKDDLRKVNEYDYSKMIGDFHLRDSMMKERKKRLKHLVEVNRKYPNQVHSMKETVRNTEEMKIKKYRIEILEKNKRYQAHQEQIKNQNEEKNGKNKQKRKIKSI